MICSEHSDAKTIMSLLVKCAHGGEVDVVDKVEVVNKKEKVNGRDEKFENRGGVSQFGS